MLEKRVNLTYPLVYRDEFSMNGTDGVGLGSGRSASRKDHR